MLENLVMDADEMHVLVKTENGGFVGAYPLTSLDDVPMDEDVRPYVWVHANNGAITVGVPLNSKQARKLGIAILLASEEVKQAENGWVQRRAAEEAA